MTEIVTANRKERRARVAPSVKGQQLVSLMKELYDGNTVRRREGEPESDYFVRLRDKALRVQRYRRKVKRTTARNARKRNRR